MNDQATPTNDGHEQSFATEAYDRSSEQGKIENDADNIFGDHGDEPGFLVALEGSAAAGFTGTITIGVDPTAAASEGGTDGGAGGAPPQGGEGGPPPDGQGGPPDGTPPGQG